MFSKASGEPLQLTIQEPFAGKQTRSWSPWSSEVWVTGFHFKINCPPDTTVVHPWSSTNSLFLHTNVCIRDHDIYILKHGCWQNHWASVAVLFRSEMRHLRQCVLWEEDGLYISDRWRLSPRNQWLKRHQHHLMTAQSVSLTKKKR